MVIRCWLFGFGLAAFGWLSVCLRLLVVLFVIVVCLIVLIRFSALIVLICCFMFLIGFSVCSLFGYCLCVLLYLV